MNVLLFLLGAALGGLFVLVVRRQEPAAGLRLLALGLLTAALLYLGFAVFGGAGARWLAIEAGGVALYGAAAWLGLRRGAGWLALGWAAHALWDVPFHAAEAFVPAFYPPLCLGFDLLVGAFIVLTFRRWSSARSSAHDDDASRKTIHV